MKAALTAWKPLWLSKGPLYSALHSEIRMRPWTLHDLRHGPLLKLLWDLEISAREVDKKMEGWPNKKFFGALLASMPSFLTPGETDIGRVDAKLACPGQQAELGGGQSLECWSVSRGWHGPGSLAHAIFRHYSHGDRHQMQNEWKVRQQQ